MSTDLTCSSVLKPLIQHWIVWHHESLDDCIKKFCFCFLWIISFCFGAQFSVLFNPAVTLSCSLGLSVSLKTDTLFWKPQRILQQSRLLDLLFQKLKLHNPNCTCKKQSLHQTLAKQAPKSPAPYFQLQYANINGLKQLHLLHNMISNIPQRAVRRGKARSSWPKSRYWNWWPCLEMQPKAPDSASAQRNTHHAVKAESDSRARWGGRPPPARPENWRVTNDCEGLETRSSPVSAISSHKVKTQDFHTVANKLFNFFTLCFSTEAYCCHPRKKNTGLTITL